VHCVGLFNRKRELWILIIALLGLECLDDVNGNSSLVGNPGAI